MNRVDMSRPAFFLTPEEQERVSRLTRHLSARMEELAFRGLEVVDTHQEEGLVVIEAPDVENLAGQLRWNCGVWGKPAGQWVLLFLRPEMRFEDLDALWGAMDELLCD